MHLKRWLTGIIAVPVLIYLIGADQRWPFYTFLFIASIAALTEYYKIIISDLPGFVRWSSYLLTAFLFIAFFMRQVLFAPAIYSLWALAPLTYYMLTHPSPDQKWTADIGKAVLGPIYVVIPLAMLVLIDMRPNGKIWIFFLLAVIFANDTGAFYFGRLLGKHKLYEAISPNKTWEGAVGGLIFSFAAAMIFIFFLAVHKLNITLIFLVLALAVTAQVGDLAESMLKRYHGIKDSGKILPGHGGLLDRIDSLLFCIPVLYLFLTWMI